MCFVVADLLDERSDLFAKLQDTLTYQHELCMNKGCTFNASIKFFNRLKTSTKNRVKNPIETTYIYLEMKVIYETIFEETRHKSSMQSYSLIFSCKFL